MIQNNNDSSLENDPSVKFGKYLAHPCPEEEIAISGIAGQFPLCSDIEEFYQNLSKKVNLITYDKPAHIELPLGVGQMKDISKFDRGFFGYTGNYNSTLNPMSKILLEKTIECIFDAGLHPADLEGTKTGVFAGICYTECELHWYYVDLVKNGGAILGNLKSMFADKICHFLKLKGPSVVCDTACSSSLYALETAYKAIRMGQCDQALVCGANLVRADGTTLQFARLGVLSKDGICKPFDETGKGYVRSEAISVILLQKAKNCKRIYAKVLHSKTNCDGYKEHGITYPSGPTQLCLLKEIYLESGIHPNDISFIEAHGTGTPVGDPEELNSIDEFFAKRRNKPLLVGSVKSSIGHSEPSSGLCSIIKAILAFETNTITPNINFKSPRKNIPGLLAGRIKVVTETTPIEDTNGLIGVSSFGFGGANAHVVLKWNTKKSLSMSESKLPILVCVSGRTEEAVQCLLNDIGEKRNLEHIALIHNIFRKPIEKHLFRGYGLVSKQGLLETSIKPFSQFKNTLYIYFGGVSKNSPNLIQELLQFPILDNIKNRIETFLIKKKISLNNLVGNSIQSVSNQLLFGMITQLCLAELIKLLEIEYERVYSNSCGKLTQAFFENILTLEETLECVFSLEKWLNNTKLSTNQSGILTEFEQILSYKKEVNYCNNSKIKRTLPKYLLDAVLQENQDDVPKIPKKSLMLVIGQSLSSIEKKRCNIITLKLDFSIQEVLSIFGKLFEYGGHPQVQKLYPKIEFPVSRGTPMISPKIKWKHDYTHFIPLAKILGSHRRFIKYSINLTDNQWSDLTGHIIDGRNLFPATGYLYLAWLLLAGIDNDFTKFKVVFENCKFLRACSFPKTSKTDNASVLSLTVMIQNVSGKFEIAEGGTPVVTGNIRVWDNELEQQISLYEHCNLCSKEIMLNSRDIYRELKLRGYHYRGVFRSLTECNKEATKGKIQWTDNWIAFMDNMLQIKILAEDTRLLYVPTSIAYMAIDPLEHLEIINDLKNKTTETSVELPVQHFRDSGIIKSGGIEIRGLLASSIPRKKNTATPVLEKYLFVPNVAKLSLEQSVRVFMQIALENNCGFNVKVGEIIETDSETNVEPLGPIIQNVLEDQPLVHSEITVLTAEDIGENIKNESELTVLVGHNLLQRSEVLRKALKGIVEAGYIISREPVNKDCLPNIPGLKIINIYETTEEKLVFLRKNAIHKEKSCIYINISNLNKKFNWLNDLKTAVKKNCDVIVWCQNEPLNGIIGLVNCIKREPDCKNVRTLFIVDQEPIFDPSNPLYKNQLDKNMSVNVFQNKQWGTYRHLLFENSQEVENEHCYVDSTVRGDLSSIKWIEGPLSRYSQLEQNESLIKVYYSALNFRDVMTASARINVDIITRDRREQECVQGFEFSGKTTSGKHVMGMVSQGALATLVKADNNLLWEIPKGWSFMDAATVPVVYSTCLYALVVVGKIKPSDSILIHSGTGGIGQAAINLCLHMGCTVFTAVGTDEKRTFIKNNFPEIKESHIGNSRDLSFEQMIMKETNGRGVDIVLNSLAEEKLLATARCLAENGRFLEIGKFDLANNNQLNLLLFKNGVSFHGVMLDKLFNASRDDKEMLKSLLQNYIDSGAIKPLMANIFEKNEVEQAFRFMTAGKHMGKVLVKVRGENDSITHTFKGLPRYYCDPNKSYIICGGLGGFGLELADWLVLRGAKHLILTSRKGVTTGYQSYRISIWKSYYCNVKIFTHDITEKSGCEELIKAANAEAPVDSVFNLAVVLADALLENQTEESFNTSFGPKAYATKYLDECTRKMCPSLRDFVVFSSVSCGRGNAGQSNYGMSNSVMERICEKRRRDGYPALAIEWGAIGDVGLVAELQEDHKVLEIGGTLQQSISNCLQVLDSLLRQNEASIVSSMVVAEKRIASASDNIVEVIGDILGIRDLKLVSMHSTLAALGMDSMSAVEVKQTLEREYNIFLAPSELRNITMDRIQELHKESLTESTKERSEKFDYFNLTQILKILSTVEEKKTSVLKLKSKSTNTDVKSLPKIIALPGIEGVCTLFENLTQHLEADIYGINYYPSKQPDNVYTWASQLLPCIQEVTQPSEPFYMMAHSIGTSLAIEILSQLEALGYLVTLILLDGSPSFNQKLTQQILLVSAAGYTGDEAVQNSLVQNILNFQLDSVETANIMGDICKLPTFKEKIIKTSSFLKFKEEFSQELLISSAVALFKRLKAILTYKPKFEKLQAKIKLFKPTMFSFPMESEDYDLGQYCKMPVEIKVFEGSHTSILENKDLAKSIMENFSLVNGFKEE